MTTMLSASPLMQTRSTLEEMLVSLLKKEENPANVQIIPPLPLRPKSKGRPPTLRSLPIVFNCRVESKARTIKMNTDSTHRTNHIQSKSMQTQETSCPDPYEVTIDYSINKLPSSNNNQWNSGVVESISENDAYVSLSGVDVRGFNLFPPLSYQSKAFLQIVKRPNDEGFPENPDLLELVDDLTLLSYLNEPSVLHAIKRRYSRDETCTKAGSVLISLNPLKKRKNSENAQLVSMINAAYNEMMRGGRDQSILISGETGAGKTETAEDVVHCLCSFSGENEIKGKIKYADLILEAFGNAKTRANNNSSRFGKLTEFQFSSEGKLSGTTIHTLPLEKARVTHVINGERSYHVFYELCNGASPSLKNQLKLKSVRDYNYLTKSDCLEINGVDETTRLDALMDAFDALKVSNDEQQQAFEILSGILWIGNISFDATKNGNYVNVHEDVAVSNSANLLSCRAEDLITCVSTQKIKVGKENVLKKLTLLQANAKRDALANFLYSCLFRWLVERINKTLRCEKENNSTSISVLDIYGYEANRINTFDTFCINYANERLRQHFLRHLFKLPLREYEDEKIDFIKINFKDNKECLDLFENKRIGLLSLIDEESNLVMSSDLTLANKINQHLPKNSSLDGRSFHVQHSGGKISYDANGFLESNRDPFNSDFVSFLSSSRSALLPHFASNDLSRADSTVSAKFQGELFELVRFLEKTTPHFIHCVKPNDNLLPDLLEDDVVQRQLRPCAIVDILRASRWGFQTRLSHREFSARYGSVVRESNEHRDAMNQCIAILLRFNVPPSMFQIGCSKVFLRTGTIEILEERQKLILKSIVRIQMFFRGTLARHHFQSLKRKATILQSYIRGGLERKRHISLVNNSPKLHNEYLQSIILVQKGIRRWLARRKLKNLAPASEIFILDKMQEAKGIVSSSVVAELKRKLRKAEEENASLRQQVSSYEKKWNELETIQHLSSPSPSMILKLEKEFDEQKASMENEANGLSEVEELKTLKLRFRSWKKEFKMRMKETKARLRKIGHGESSRSYRRWWGKGR